MTKVFMNGGSQAVRIPAEFRFDYPEVNITKDPVTGNLIVTPAPYEFWDQFKRDIEEARESHTDPRDEQFTKLLEQLRSELNGVQSAESPKQVKK